MDSLSRVAVTLPDDPKGLLDSGDQKCKSGFTTVKGLTSPAEDTVTVL